jgi:hypothetical protein
MNNRYVILKDGECLMNNLSKENAECIVEVLKKMNVNLEIVFDEYYEHTPYTEEGKEQINRLVN